MTGLTAVEADLERVWRKYHVRAQIARFVSGWVAAFLWGMAHGFTDWTTLVPIASTAAWTAAMEAWPQVPWKLIRARLRSRAGQGPDAGPATAPPYAPPGGMP